MRHRVIGDTTVTAVGVGDVRLATADARGLDHFDVERALHDALELGITFIDSSEEDAAERLCGDTIRALRLRDRAVVATRLLALPEVVGPPRDRLPERLPVGYIRERVEASLRTTRLEALPLVLVELRPEWRDSRAWPELTATLTRLVREGHVMRWGALVDDPAAFAAKPTPAATPPAVTKPTSGGLILLLEDAAAAPPPVAEPPAPARELAEPFVAIATPSSACRPITTQLPLLARAPLAGGALTGRIGPGMKLALRDDRRALDAATLDRIASGCAKLAPLVRDEPPAARSTDPARAILERHPREKQIEATTLAELALRYLIDRGALALPRLHRNDHVAEAIAAASAAPLSADAHARIAAALG